MVHRLSLLLLIAANVNLVWAQELRVVEGLRPEGFLWPSEPPEDCPFEPSPLSGGVYFTGKHSNYNCGDTWYPSWAANDKLYSPWTDGVTNGVFSSSATGADATTGHAVMKGDDPVKLEFALPSPPFRASALPYEGRYPCGSLVHDGVWYYGTYCLGPSSQVMHDGISFNWPVLGPMPGFRISHDYGKTWTASPHTPEEPLFPEPEEYLGPVKMGAPHFVDFGKNMSHSPDGKAYLLGMGAVADDPKPRFANLSWISADQVYLARVTPSPDTINDLAAYEFYAGKDAEGKAVWTGDFKEIAPLLEWNNNMGCVTATWVPGLKKYLMCVTDGWPTVAQMNSYILEADVLTGPWRLVSYMRNFGEQAYFLNFPSKFISQDGRTLWMCYSANFSPRWRDEVLAFNPPGGRYGLCLHEMRLLAPGEKPPMQEKVVHPVARPENLAPEATVTTSSTHPGYGADGVNDRRIGGWPGDVEAEWASAGEKAGAWARLTWDTPVRVGRVWFFDRPNGLDRVTALKVELSDGAMYEVARPLADGAEEGLEVSFAPRTTEWIKVTVLAAREGSLNVGFSEVAVFDADPEAR